MAASSGRSLAQEIELRLEQTFQQATQWGQCFKCGEQMIQGGDHDDESGDHAIVSNFHCPSCGSDALFFWG